MSEPLGFGPARFRDTACCGKPAGCTSMSDQCLLRHHPWKRRNLDSILGRECPSCGDSYHDLARHLELNYKGCADETIEPGTPIVLLSVSRRLPRGTTSCHA